MTLLDGKVLNILTETKSCQLCPICGASLKDFMENAKLDSPKFKPRHETLKYGISPLHGWIRFFEFILKIAYRLKLKNGK